MDTIYGALCSELYMCYCIRSSQREGEGVNCVPLGLYVPSPDPLEPQNMTFIWKQNLDRLSS